MQLYNVKVRLGGSVLNEVRKPNVTAAEIIVLREMHGSDAVVDIKATRVDRRSHAEERKRLAAVYASPDRNNAEQLKAKQTMLRNLFGHDSMELPVKLSEPVEDAEVVEKPRRTKIETQAAESRAVLE